MILPNVIGVHGDVVVTFTSNLEAHLKNKVTEAHIITVSVGSFDVWLTIFLFK